MPLNLIFLGIVFLFSSTYTIMAVQLPMGEWAMPGPGLLPTIAGAMAVLLSAYILMKDAKVYLSDKKIQRDAPVQGSEIEEQSGDVAYPWRILWFVLAFILYVAAFRPLGYLLATFLFVTALFRIMANKWLMSVINGAATAVSSYLLFTLLVVPLPAGILAGII